MLINRKITIVLVAQERLVRADFSLVNGKPPALRGLWLRARPEQADLVSLVEAALRQGGKRPGRTLVLSSDVWTQTVRMPTGNCMGLSDDELSRALGFEAEPLSGIDAFDSLVALQSMPADGLHRDFWIVQASASQVDEIDALVRQVGGRLLAVSHPAGVPRPLAASIAPMQPGNEDEAYSTAGPLSPGPSPARGQGRGETHEALDPSSLKPQASSLAWQRIELWPTAIVGIHGSPGRPALVHVVPSNPMQRGWEAEMDKWRAAAGQAEYVEWLLPDASLTALVAERTNTLPDAAPEAHHLDEDESLRVWLTAWAAEAFSRAPAVPLIHPLVRPLSAQRRMAISALLAAIVGTACLGHYAFNVRKTTELKARTAVIQQQIDTYKTLQKQLGEAQSKRKNAQEQLDALRDKVTYCVDTLAAHRLRWKRLLVLLAELRPEDLVVQKIDGTGQKLVIHGLCLGPHPANELASNLGDGLRDLEWQVQPAKQQVGKVWAKGEPWKFELMVREVPLPVPAALSAPAKKPAPPASPPPPTNPPSDKFVTSPATTSQTLSPGARRDEAQD